MKCINFAFLLIILSSFSCVKDYKSSTTVKLKNSTTHKVELFAFTGNVLDTSKSFILNSFSERVIEYSDTWGKSTKPIALGEYFTGLDSIKVKWADSFSVTYMIGAGYSSNGKFIAYDDTLKNFVYMQTYSENLLEDHKGYSIWELVFSFTEKDYEYAKD